MKSFFRLLKKLMAKRNLTWARACFFLMVVLVIVGVLWKGGEAWAGSLTGTFGGWSQATCYESQGVPAFIGGPTIHSGSGTISTPDDPNIQPSPIYKSLLPGGHNQGVSRLYEIGASFQNSYYAKLSLTQSVGEPTTSCCSTLNPNQCDTDVINNLCSSFNVPSSVPQDNPCSPWPQCETQSCVSTDYSGLLGGDITVRALGSGGTGGINVNNSGELSVCEPGVGCPGAGNDFLLSQFYSTIDHVGSQMNNYGPNPVAWTFSYQTSLGPSSVKNVSGSGVNTVTQKPLYPLAVLVDGNGNCVYTDDHGRCKLLASSCGTVSYYADSEGTPVGVKSYSSSDVYYFVTRLSPPYTQAWNESSGSPWDDLTDDDCVSGRPVNYYDVLDTEVILIPDIIKNNFCYEYYWVDEGENPWGKYYNCLEGLNPLDISKDDSSKTNKEVLDEVLNNYYNKCKNNLIVCPIYLKTFNALETSLPLYRFPAVSDSYSQIMSREGNMKDYAVQVPATLKDASCDVTINGGDHPPNPLSCTVTVSPNPANIGATVTWAVEPTGGAGSYSYSWSGDLGSPDFSVCPPNGCRSFNTTYSDVGDNNGWAIVQASVTSLGDGQKVNCSNTVNILEPLSVSCFASPNLANKVSDCTVAEFFVAWTAQPLGGTGNYTYTWSHDLGCCADTAGDSQTFTTQYDTGGKMIVNIDVTEYVTDSQGNKIYITDSQGHKITAHNTCSLQVGPQVSCQGLPSTSDIGQSIIWASFVYPPPNSSNFQGYGYNWQFTDTPEPVPPAGAITTTESVATTKYGTTGPKDATVTVTFPDSSSITSAPCSVNVGPPPTSLFQDIGLRIYNAFNQIIKIAVESLGTLTSPLRIFKNGIKYGIALVNPGDSNDSGVRIQTSSGPQALRKCNLSGGECR